VTQSPAPAERQVRLEPSGRTFTVNPGETVLEAGLRCGLALANSCRQGVCGTCRMRKLSGEVEMHQNGGLFDDEVEDGVILACCSFPLTPIVVECL
jgi:ferredoxin